MNGWNRLAEKTYAVLAAVGFRSSVDVSQSESKMGWTL